MKASRIPEECSAQSRKRFDVDSLLAGAKYIIDSMLDGDMPYVPHGIEIAAQNVTEASVLAGEIANHAATCDFCHSGFAR